MAKNVNSVSVENVTPATVNAENVKKEGKKAMTNKKQNPATVETVSAETVTPATAPAPAPVEAETTPAPAPAPVVAPVVETNPPTVEALRTEILGKIKEEQARLSVWEAVNVKGEDINATNWGKDITKAENETMGGYVRAMLKRSKELIKGFKRDLKQTYFDLLPELKALQDSENETAKALIIECVEKMHNTPVFVKQEQVTTETVQALASAGVKNIGVSQELLGFAIVLFNVNGYIFDTVNPQPVTVDRVEIDGLDPVDSFTYYNFVKA